MSSGDDAELRVVDNPAELRYELRAGDALAGFLLYRLEPGVVVLIHTDIEVAWRGRGLGSRLVEGALDDVRARGLSVAALCPFAASYLRAHPGYADLVVDDPAISD